MYKKLCIGWGDSDKKKLKKKEKIFGNKKRKDVEKSLWKKCLTRT